MLLLLGPSLPQWLDVDLLNSDLLLSLFHFAENTKHTPEFYQSEVITLINYCSIHDLSHCKSATIFIHFYHRHLSVIGLGTICSIHYLFCVKEVTLHSYSYPLGNYLRPHLEICKTSIFLYFFNKSAGLPLYKTKFCYRWMAMGPSAGWFRDAWRCCLTNISSIRTSVESSFGGDSR